MDHEATPTLEPVLGVDLDAYKRTLIERFSNPAVRDTIARLAAETSDRIPKWLVPVVRRQLATGGPIARSARRQGYDPTAFIADRELFGDLVDDERFVAAYTAALDSLHRRGARATLEAIVAEGSRDDR